MINRITMKDLEDALNKISKSDAPDLRDRLELAAMLLDSNAMSVKEIQDYVEYQKKEGNHKYSISSILTMYLYSKSDNEESKGIVPYVQKVLSSVECYLKDFNDPDILNPSLRIEETKKELDRIEKEIDTFIKKQEVIEKELNQLSEQKNNLDNKRQEYEQDLERYNELKRSTETIQKQITEFEECISNISIDEMEAKNQKLIDDFKRAKEKVLNNQNVVDYLINVKKLFEACELAKEIEDVVLILKTCEIDYEVASNIEFNCSNENIKPIRSAKLKLEEPFRELEKELKIILEKMIQE